MAVSKTLRFEIFKRDQFSCRYCGQNPPAVILEVDHVIPLAKEGTDDIENLITSCFDCNRGKGARELGNAIKPLAESAAEMLEREEQLKAYRKLLHSIKRRKEREIDEVEKVFTGVHEGYSFTSSFRTSVKRNFLSKLPVDEVVEAMQIACARGLERDSTIKYFCGVAWKVIREKERSHAN